MVVMELGLYFARDGYPLYGASISLWFLPALLTWLSGELLGEMYKNSVDERCWGVR
jgi:hypothetical protein